MGGQYARKSATNFLPMWELSQQDMSFSKSDNKLELRMRKR